MGTKIILKITGKQISRLKHCTQILKKYWSHYLTQQDICTAARHVANQMIKENHNCGIIMYPNKEAQVNYKVGNAVTTK